MEEMVNQYQKPIVAANLSYYCAKSKCIAETVTTLFQTVRYRSLFLCSSTLRPEHMNVGRLRSC